MLIRNAFGPITRTTGMSMIGVTVGVAVAGILALSLTGILTNGFKGARRIANMGEIEDLKNYVRTSNPNCSLSLYKPATSELIDACTTGRGFVALKTSATSTVISTPLEVDVRPNGVVVDTVPNQVNKYFAYTRLLGKFDTRVSCPTAGSTQRLKVEYRNSAVEAESEWKDLFKGQSILCRSILDSGGAQDTGNSCPDGQYVSSVNFAAGTVACADLPPPQNSPPPSPRPRQPPNPSPPMGGAGCTLVFHHQGSGVSGSSGGRQTASSGLIPVTLVFTPLGQVDSALIDGTPIVLNGSNPVDVTKNVRGKNLQAVATVTNSGGAVGSCSVTYDACPIDRLVRSVLPATANENAQVLLATGLSGGETVSIEAVSGQFDLGLVHTPWNCFEDAIHLQNRPKVVMKAGSSSSREYSLVNFPPTSAPAGTTDLYAYIPDWVPQDNTGSCSFTLRIHEACDGQGISNQ